MSEEVQGKGLGIGADVVLEFSKSITNIQAFGEQLELLDARFGSIDQRIDSMRNSLSALSSQASKSSGNNLRKQIEQELNHIIESNGATLSSIGTAPLKVRQDTVRNLFARVDAELNRAILKQIGNINVKIDPNYNTGTVPIGKDEFDQLNREIARLVKAQVKNLVNSVHENGGKMIKKDNLTGLELDISKNTVKQILLSIKEQIIPLILNPNLDVEGQSLTISQRDLSQMMRKIKEKIKGTLDFDFEGVLKKDSDIEAEIFKTARKIDSVVENYAKSMRSGIERIDPRTVEVPMKKLSKRLQQYIADDLKVSPTELNKTLGSIDTGSAQGYEIRRQFSALERTINNKVTAGTSKLMTELRRSVRSVDLESSGSLKHHLIHEINKLNNDIVKKIRESIDKQFEYMRAEVGSVTTDQKTINRNGRLRSMSSPSGSGNVYNNTVINNNTKNDSSKSYSDPYSRRDEHFNSFGLEGAVTNTVRHIIAGSMVGAPMMAMYQAVDSFKTSQEEQLKIMQNMSLKDEYIDNSSGQTNWGKVDTDLTDLMGKVKQMSNFYSLGYDQMSQVAAIASRLTEDKDEAQMFTDQSAKIYRLDNESDLVGTIAPGLEAIMAQFKLSVWELNDVVSAFAVATNKTKATSDEVMKAITRSGSALNASGVAPDEAIALNAIAIQRSGQSGEVVGNMFKTLAARVTLPTVVDSLKGKGIDVYETNDLGLKERRSLIDILKDTAKVTNGGRTGEDEIAKIMLDEGGGYHYSKVMSFLDDMNAMGTGDLNFFKMMEQIEDFQKNPEKLATMLTKTMNAPTVNMERAGVSMNNALTSILEEMSPEIQMLSQNITNLAQGLKDNAATIANVINLLTNALIGYGAMYGVKRLGQWGEYEKHKSNAEMRRNFLGGETLTGRQKYGAVQFMDSYMLGGSRESKGISSRMSDRSFYDAAMKNDILRPYIQELSTMDRDRQREIRQYVKEHGTAGNMADLFSIMDESRGYRQSKQSLTVDEVHRRSSHNARNLIDTKSLESVFDRTFATHLVGTLQDRQRFDNLGKSDRNTAGRLAEMDDTTRRSFVSFLDENYKSTGRTIKDMDELNSAMNEYQERTRQNAATTRRGSDSYRDLSRAIRDVGNEAERASRGRMTSFLNLIDSIPDRARGAGGAIMGVARNIGNFAKQLGVALAVGDLIEEVGQNTLLTDGQKDIRNHRNSKNEAAKQYAEYEEGGGYWGELSSFSQAGKGIMLDWNMYKDMFLGTNTSVGRDDVDSFKDEFEKWMKSQFGTSDWKKAVKIANEEAKAKDKYADEVTLDDLTKRYLDDSGSNKELQKMEEKEFIRQYKEFAISEAEQADRKRKAEEARKAWENQMYDEGQLQWFSVDQMKARIEERVTEVKGQNSLDQMNALLSGVKSDSEEYLKIRLQAIQKERQAYKEEIELLNQFVKDREEALRYLEAQGRRWAKDENGDPVYTKDGKRKESEEYSSAQEALKEAKSKQSEVNKEFEPKMKELQLEEQRTKVDGYISIMQNNVSRIQARKQYEDTLNSLTMNTESPEYIDAQINSNRGAIYQMQSELANLQSQNMADPDNKLQDAILGLQQQIASAQVEVKNLRLQRLQAWRTPFNNSMDDLEIKFLQDRVSLGSAGVSDDSYLAKDLRIRELQERKSLVDKTLAQRRADLANYSKGSSEYEQIMKDIRDLTKQSLQAQLGIHQELKAQMGGTFNLPDGVHAMSQYDYMASKGSHSNLTLQSGDMYVNITLPNVTETTGSQQLANIGNSLGMGLAQGRTAQLRNQINSSPYSYRTF
ncbi:phage tail tape measure protein [Bacillus licheniformis]|uniref:phage tail tape measure protein n=1 Tax=Bacillus licheniformis TaxID=1402 RepID=UPI00227FEFE6|nr:phage tail tape measure protein [Bacillus licheniformis]MCY8745100.1 phage tail tape measure protein [Bacillus licheniformis]